MHNKDNGYKSNPNEPSIEIVKIGIRLNIKKIKRIEKTEIKVIPLFNLAFLILSSLVFVGYTAKIPPVLLFFKFYPCKK